MSDEPARLLAFPIDRRTALVRETAGELFQLNGDSANTYWRTKARELLADLTEQGRDMETAREEVLRFFAAVQDEFRKELSHRRSLAIA
jgi:hypothetical protein